MYLRTLSGVIKRFAQIYPVVGITGPRQSGKTTLARTLFPNIPYVSLENLDTRYQAESDPRAFLDVYKDGAIFDEVQHAPHILSYLQEIVDMDSRKGRYVITGSQNFVLSNQVSQSLSGRVGMVTLLPLSLEELGEGADIHISIFKGGYPGLHKMGVQPFEFYPSYLQTYIERDVRQLKAIEHIGTFQTFLKLCAGRIGQLLNLSSLAQDAGISHATARQWLTLLEASYIVFTLQPYHQNFNKRLVKMPKIYFYDTGLACSLLGIESDTQLQTHYLRGGLFENLMILEVLKARLNQGRLPNLYFWRDHTGHEIDLIGEWGGGLHAIEIKMGATFQPDFLKGLQQFHKIAPEAVRPSIKNYLLYTGTRAGQHLDVNLVPADKIATLIPIQ